MLRICFNKLFFISILALLLLSGCDALQPPPNALTQQHSTLQPVAFADLPGWNADQHATAFYAFKKSCRPLQKSSEWRTVCQAALQVNHISDQEAQQFFEHWFTPYAVTADTNPQGLFTGYYLPEINVSSKKTAYFSAPLYARPRDLIVVDLGEFKPEWRGKLLAGRFVNGQVKPYGLTRKAIDAGALAGKAQVIAWANPIDRFFMQIQGSGLLIIDHRQKVLIGYNGNNGYAYVAIGKVLVQQGELDFTTLSMETIRQWLVTHPQQAQEVMEKDPSFVFFKKLPGQTPVGTLQIPLTPGRSLAVDPTFVPLGAPVWVETTIPNIANSPQQVPLQRLFIAQDTGGAIRGVVRADLYWGPGSQAEFLASRLKSPGRYWLLLPIKSREPSSSFAI